MQAGMGVVAVGRGGRGCCRHRWAEVGMAAGRDGRGGCRKLADLIFIITGSRENRKWGEAVSPQN